MRTNTVLGTLSCLALTACGVGLDSSKGASKDTQEPWLRPAPRATCALTDAQETGVQGQVPLADRLSGRSQQAYACNLELVGQHQGDGANWQAAWYGDCAYYGTVMAEGRQNGAVVVDASDPANPVATSYLDTPATADPHESLKVNERRGLLAAVDLNNEGFDVYDVSGDCAQPALMASFETAGVVGHEGEWAPDGFTYYGSGGGRIAAYDVADPASALFFGLLEVTPQGMPQGSHGLNISDDGKRGYFTAPSCGNGLKILDTSLIQSRKGTETPLISEVCWNDGFAAQHTIPVTIGGHPYLIFVDELGSGGTQLFELIAPTQGSPAFIAGAVAALAAGPYYACANEMPAFGFTRIFDIADDTNPKLVSHIRLETSDPANCGSTLPDIAGQFLFSYDSHYCGVDRRHEATALACGFFNSGIRVFDIRDPYRPREIAYYIPPARLSQQSTLPGSGHTGTKDADWCAAQVRFVPERGELWTACMDNGFMILKFTDGVWPFAE